jgi:uncharacterized membrane protein YphA (DoxX/SURF4 family)
MVGKVVLWLLRLAVAGVFLTAGILKIWDFTHGRPATPDFTIAIQRFELIPWPDLTVALAVYLPWVEVITALGLFWRRLALGAALATTGMSAVFLIALASAWARGLDISCSCFGKSAGPVDYPTAILRDVLLLVASLALVIHEARRAPKQPSPGTSAT